MKILAIGAHPDDIEAGCSGSLAKYAQNGHEIYLLIMTEGHMGGEGSVRKKEQRKFLSFAKRQSPGLFKGKKRIVQKRRKQPPLQLSPRVQ